MSKKSYLQTHKCGRVRRQQHEAKHGDASIETVEPSDNDINNPTDTGAAGIAVEEVITIAPVASESTTADPTNDAVLSQVADGTQLVETLANMTSNQIILATSSDILANQTQTIQIEPALSQPGQILNSTSQSGDISTAMGGVVYTSLDHQGAEIVLPPQHIQQQYQVVMYNLPSDTTITSETTS